MGLNEYMENIHRQNALAVDRGREAWLNPPEDDYDIEDDLDINPWEDEGDF